MASKPMLVADCPGRPIAINGAENQASATPQWSKTGIRKRMTGGGWLGDLQSHQMMFCHSNGVERSLHDSVRVILPSIAR